MNSIKQLCFEIGFKQFSKQDLFIAIQKSNSQRIKLIASVQPELFRTHFNRQSPLSFAASKNAFAVIPLLINIGCSVNHYDKTQQTPIFHAISRNHCLSVKLLIQNGANLKMTVGKYSLTPLDYSILSGFYQIAFQIFTHLVCVSGLHLKYSQNVSQFDANSYFNFKHPRFYGLMAKKYHYRYVNHQMFIKSLVQGIKPKNADTQALITRNKQNKFQDPVYDPRQNCSQWIARVLKFKAPNKIERQQLPQEYRRGTLLFNRLKFIIKSCRGKKPSSQKNCTNTADQKEIDVQSDKRIVYLSKTEEQKQKNEQSGKIVEVMSNPYY